MIPDPSVLDAGGQAVPDDAHRGRPVPRNLLPDSAAVGGDGWLAIGGCSTAALAAEFGTPLFVYDEDHLRARCREAVATFGDGVSYASKAFLCLAMARLVHEEGMHIDVATGGEPPFRYGLLCCAMRMFTAGFGLSALALTTVVLSTVGPSGALAGHLAPRHFHDFGKLLLAFTMLWAYLNFSQFLIIWSGNLPEEIPWYIERMHGTWGFVAVALVVGHFFLPFLLLLSQSLKKSKWLPRVAIFILVMRLVDTIFLIGPSWEHHGFPIHWSNVAIPAGLAGVWLFLFARNLKNRPLMPLNDPYMKEAFHEAH